MSLIFNKELLIIVAEIPKKTIEAEVYTDVYTDVYTRRNILDRGFTLKWQVKVVNLLEKM